LEHAVEERSVGLVVDGGVDADESTTRANVLFEGTRLFIVQYDRFGTLWGVGVVAAVEDEDIILIEFLDISRELCRRGGIILAIDEIDSNFLSATFFGDFVP